MPEQNYEQTRQFLRTILAGHRISNFTSRRFCAGFSRTSHEQNFTSIQLTSKIWSPAQSPLLPTVELFCSISDTNTPVAFPPTMLKPRLWDFFLNATTLTSPGSSTLEPSGTFSGKGRTASSAALLPLERRFVLPGLLTMLLASAGLLLANWASRNFCGLYCARIVTFDPDSWSILAACS